jgi:capsid assembly protease
VTRYPNVLRAITETPWAIREEMLPVIAEIVAVRASGGAFSAEEIEARIGAGNSRGRGVQVGPVAVIPIYGVIAPRANLMTEMSGGTSLQAFSAELSGAVNAPDVSAILLDVQSPGGSTALVPETAARIREAKARKPVVAVANTDAFSAAYWLASQASELVVTESGMVGSIGTYIMHDDLSAALEQAGVKRTFVKAGERKVEGNPYEPLTDAAREAMQELVDEFQAMFVRDVARGRGLSAARVRQDFGRGGTVTASKALAAGMVDRIDTFEATLARLARGNRPGRGSVSHTTFGEDHVPSVDALDPPQGDDEGALHVESAEATLRAFLLTKRIQEVTAR